MLRSKEKNTNEENDTITQDDFNENAMGIVLATPNPSFIRFFIAIAVRAHNLTEGAYQLADLVNQNGGIVSFLSNQLNNGVAGLDQWARGILATAQNEHSISGTLFNHEENRSQEEKNGNGEDNTPTKIKLD